ncbi:hypothetical protein Tco_1089424 [Tanacetum coccineum]
MVACKPRQETTITDEEGVNKKKAPSAGKSKQPVPAKQSKPVKEKTSKPTSSKKVRKGKVMKVRKGKKSDDLVDEDDEVQHAPEPQVEDDEYNLQRGIQMSLESLQAHGQAPLSGLAIRELVSGITRKLPDVEGKGKGIATDEQVGLSLLYLQKTKEQSVKDQYIFQRRIPMTHDASTGPSTQP